MSSSNLQTNSYISAIVNHANSYITLIAEMLCKFPEGTTLNFLPVNFCTFKLRCIFICLHSRIKRGQVIHRTYVFVTLFESAVTSTFNIICERPGSGAYGSLFSFHFCVVCVQHTNQEAIEISACSS